MESVAAFQSMGKQVVFGGLRIQLCAFPRRLQQNGQINYSDKNTYLPKGEQFYPFKLGYKLVDFNPYTKIENIYKFLRWQLLFEKKVRFLNEQGKIVAIKENSRWPQDHLQALDDILAVGKTDLQIQVAKLLEA